MGIAVRNIFFYNVFLFKLTLQRKGTTIKRVYLCASIIPSKKIVFTVMN